MTLIKYPLLFLFISSSVLAQQLSHPVMVSRDDAFLTPRQFRIVADTVDILAVMVQFQQDNTPLTSGDGRFDLTQETNPIIEAPPHNKQYFLDHFTFLANYFRKASKGKVIVRATVLDSVITLAGVMQDYAPPRVGATIAVGNLARDAWQKVDSAGLVANFSQYESFVVLHAGTGRDIDLVGLLGYDPTPYDIPSLYIGLNGFRQYYGSGYQGIPVNGGSFHITNSIVIPESENRLLPTVSGNVLLELSINGLLCASLGNFLGLPDLFDTNTGRSGIGRFGLMDGQAIFSFKGVFPPEPSAWEKYWLGWIEPITLQAGEQILALPAVGIATARGNFSVNDTVYRVPISAQEYYLIENRNRDPHDRPQEAGQKVYSTFRGAGRMQPFPRDTVGFNAFDIDSLAGVVTDVEDFDWSLPGGVSQDGTFFDGGVLIWHIDEAVIAQGLQANGVNANPTLRGVDLEEADGSQDIGQQYEFLSPGSGSEEGTALDFWYLGNGSPVNKNIFSPTSHPDSRSNTGANSHITISNFSARGPHMTAKVNVGDDVVQLLPGFPKVLDQQLASPSLVVAQLVGDDAPEIVVATNGKAANRPSRIVTTPILGGEIFAWKSNGQPVLAGMNSDGLFTRLSTTLSGFSGAPAVSDLDRNGIPDVVVGTIHPSAQPQFVNAYAATPGPLDSLAQVYFSVPSSIVFTTSPTIGDSLMAIGGSGGRVLFLQPNGTPIDSARWLQDSSAAVTGISQFDNSKRFIITGSDGTVIINGLQGIVGSPSRNVGRSIAGPAVMGDFGSPGNPRTRIAFATSDGFVYLADQQLNIVPGFPVSTGGVITQPPALGDVDGDGIRDIIVFSSGRIHAFNYSGASLDYFPITVSSTAAITSHPIVADVNGDGAVEIVAVTSEGLVVAHDKTGRMAPGFPLQAGTGVQSLAVFDIPNGSLSSGEIGLAVASSASGSVIAWRTGSTRIPYDAAKLRPWPQYQKDAQHSGLALEPLTGTPLSSQFFPKERAYNWPNPVYDGKTFIRYFVKDNATVNIKVFDLAGDLVTTIPNPPGVGGVDNEVEWNVGGVQSGIYFARIEANGGGGSGVAVVKIAVVK